MNTKRDFPPELVERIVRALDAATAAIGGIDKTIEKSVVCCITCDHFDGQLEKCKLANARPPATVIAFGCPSYEMNLPF